MIYLIGGPPRVGKSSLARLMLERLDVAGVSTDALVQMLRPFGVPDRYDRSKSRIFKPYLERFEAELTEEGLSYVIEGDALWPDDVAKLSRGFRVIFLGASQVSEQRLFEDAPHWLARMSTINKSLFPERIIESSAAIEVACGRLGLEYVDMSGDWAGQLERAYALLTEKRR